MATPVDGSRSPSPVGSPGSLPYGAGSPTRESQGVTGEAADTLRSSTDGPSEAIRRGQGASQGWGARIMSVASSIRNGICHAISSTWNYLKSMIESAKQLVTFSKPSATGADPAGGGEGPSGSEASTV